MGWMSREKETGWAIANRGAAQAKPVRSQTFTFRDSNAYPPARQGAGRIALSQYNPIPCRGHGCILPAIVMRTLLRGSVCLIGLIYTIAAQSKNPFDTPE